MKRKKMLYIASTFGHLKSFHIPYIAELIRQGFEITAAGMGNGSDFVKCFKNYEEGLCRGSEEGIDFSDFNKVELTELLKVEEIPFEKNMFSLKNSACTLKIFRLIKREKFDIISVHTSLAAFFVRLAVMLAYPSMIFCKNKIKSEAVNDDKASNIALKYPRVINTVHGYLFDEKCSGVKNFILLLAEKLTSCVTDTVAVMNMRDCRIAERYRLYSRKLVKIDGYGIDVKRFKKKESFFERDGLQEKDEVIEKNKFVMIYAAEFSKRKNQEFLIKAMSELPEEVILRLAGKGELLEDCKKLAAECGEAVNNRIEFLGHVSGLEEDYHKADICVSSSRSEGLPFNIMEAMAAGLPIVASRVKGHEDLVENGKNGYLYDFDDEEEFVSAVNKLKKLKEEDLFKKRALEGYSGSLYMAETDDGTVSWSYMCKSNVQKAEFYDLKRVKPQVISIYGEICYERN